MGNTALCHIENNIASPRPIGQLTHRTFYFYCSQLTEVEVVESESDIISDLGEWQLSPPPGDLLD